MDFAVPVDEGMKIIEGEKVDKYLELARELKNCDGDTNYSWSA